MWNDYICPWAYAARPLTEWLQNAASERGIEVVTRSFELHPELPLEGAPVRPGGRLDRVFDHIAEQCEANGMAFTKPTRSPNSRSVLERAEIVNAHWPDAFAAFDRRLAAAHWVEGLAIDDPAVVAAIATSAGVDPTALDQLATEGVGAALLAESHALAAEVGAAATPSWLVGELVITGLHPEAQFHRWMTRLLDRAG